MKYLFCYIVLYLFCSACSEEKLEIALRDSGQNREELEKVLDYFSRKGRDSLKLKAAIFLIENMPNHNVVQNNDIDELRSIIRYDTVKTFLFKKCYEIVLNCVLDFKNVNHRPLCEEITSEYLIHYIEQVLESYENYYWLHEQDFQVFLEYVLPFLFENECVDYWRDSLYPSTRSLESVKSKNEIKYSIINSYYTLSLNEEQNVLESKRLNDLFGGSIEKHCYFLAYRQLLQNRALGIPSAVDFIPHYANRNGCHYWVSLILSEGENLSLEIKDRKVAKIYRRTYSHNRHIVAAKDEFVPELLLSPFNKDVTDFYLNTCDLNVPIISTYDQMNNYYLGVFSDSRWNAVVFGDKNGQNVCFNNMGKDIVYLPFSFLREKLYPFNYPFILNQKGMIKYLKPDTLKRQKITIRRKYPLNVLLNNYIQMLDSLCVEASNDSVFNKVDTILFLRDNNLPYLSGNVANNKTYQYWRLSGRRGSYCEIAELVFIDSQNNVVQGKVSSKYDQVADNDVLTNASLCSGEKLIINFDTPIKLSRLVCLPRSDGNGVYPNNVYELRYFDLDGWHSLGKTVAVDYEVKYDNVPSNALLWLRNLTEGIEERIFTIENEEPRFW